MTFYKIWLTLRAAPPSLTVYWTEDGKVRIVVDEIEIPTVWWLACSVARIDWTVLIAEVVGEVLASLSLSPALSLLISFSPRWSPGLELCLSLLQLEWDLGLELGRPSDSHEQLGEHGASYLVKKIFQSKLFHHKIFHHSHPILDWAKLRAVSLSVVVSATPSLSSLNGML